MADLLSPAARAALEARLESIRERTLALVAPLDWATLRRQHIPILSPMVWDLGHVGQFEEMWLSQAVGGRGPLVEGYQTMFDAVLNPRPTREKLALPADRRRLMAYLCQVREAALAALHQPAAGVDPELLADGLVFEMVAEHEEQHQETVLQLLQVLDDPPYVPPVRRRLPAAREVLPGMVEVPAGPFRMGHAGPGFSYDNERESHEVDLPAFRIDRFPVTCGELLAFLEDGGYLRDELWSAAGRAWRDETGATAPRNWRRDGDAWTVRFLDRRLPLSSRKPVVHVTLFEAEAYARWAGKRLPTEAEWEKAALWDPATGHTRRWPWGDRPPTPRHANLDQLAFEPAEIGSYPEGASPCGAEQMIGDVWEWTASDFTPYPGFRAYPYAEYSEIFFGREYKVLRGGSWATRPAVARATFRNWDLPIRSQIFAGFRCAADA